MDKGLRILFDTYWCSKGWKDGDISKEDFAVSKGEGYMFDYPHPIKHSELLKQIHEVTNQITPADVANAFLYSLSTRKLEYRSPLGSYWYAVAIPQHVHTEGTCYICNWSPWAVNPDKYDIQHGINVFNFERYKWGGVRHTHAAYALFDLKQFLNLPKEKATEEDKKTLHEILSCVTELEPHNKAGKLQQLISKRKILKSNANEIDVLLDILGICGVLSSERAPCYVDCFPDVYHRNPPELTNDREYPLNSWKAVDGINKERYRVVFGEKG